MADTDLDQHELELAGDAAERLAANTRDRAWFWRKANALAAALPGAPVQTIALLLSVATAETGAGDAWPGEHNWGATTRRPLSNAEQAVIAKAGVLPVLSPATARVAAEQAAAEALRSAGINPPDAAIHADSRPPHVVYFTWFAKFESDEQGAAYFARFFHTQAEQAALAAGDPAQLAAAMRAAGYYTGVHDEHAADPKVAAENRARNIADYTAWITPLYVAAKTALWGWTPGGEPVDVPPPLPPPSSDVVSGPDGKIDLATTRGVQHALNVLGASPPLAEDGIWGPRTRAAVVAYQAARGLVADGIIGSRTRAVITADLAKIA